MLQPRISLKVKIYFVLVALLLLSALANVFALYQLRIAYQRIALLEVYPAGVGDRGEAGGKERGSVDDTPLIAFVGDSRVRHWNPLPPVDCRVVQIGKPGHTTSQVRLWLESVLRDYQPSVLVIQCGINDVLAIGPHPGLQEDITANCCRNLAHMAAIASEREIRVVLMTVLPTGTVDLKRRFVWNDGIEQARRQVNAFILQLAEREDTITVNVDPILTVKGKLKSQYARDTVHLNVAGYQALNTLLYPILDKQLTSLAKVD